MTDPAPLQLTVNGRPAEVPTGATLETLIRRHLGLDGKVPPSLPVAAEVNARIVTRAEWSSCQLASGDTVEIIGAQGGG